MHNTLPPFLFAHEVYVLDHNSINADQHNHAVTVWQALSSAHNVLLFALYTILIVGILIAAFYLSRRRFFTNLGSRLNKATIFAPDIIRIAFGASLLFSVSHGALYGPELP